MIALLRVSLSLQAPIIPAKERHPANVILAATKLVKPGGNPGFRRCECRSLPQQGVGFRLALRLAGMTQSGGHRNPPVIPAKAGIPRFSSITEVWVR